ncbi:flagellar basal-body rod protein FlgF [Planococcus sp. YIM B11945]|uniref:flagellar basal-body rod protein FlgF n=1 Tax=Planococcus sp. YIM B11945 TaxID=3435410 RepID=UPI003D7EBCFE
MLRSLYSGVSGMKGFQTKLDVIGNNIANVNTVGYKKSTINFQDLLSQNLSGKSTNPMQVGLGSTTGAINVVHTAGSSMNTGVGTDVSIQGDGFFVVENGGQQFLTRAGNFGVDEGGNLVTSQGYNVLGQNGQPINVAGADSFSINAAGEVISLDASGAEIAGSRQTMAVVSPTNPSGLSKVGGSMYGMPANTALGTATSNNTQLASGMLEMSNVDLTEEFTEMIIAQRGFQANSRTITTSDEILQEVVNLKR